MQQPSMLPTDFRDGFGTPQSGSSALMMAGTPYTGVPSGKAAGWGLRSRDDLPFDGPGTPFMLVEAEDGESN
jgi:hypothetical protein